MGKLVFFFVNAKATAHISRAVNRRDESGCRRGICNRVLLAEPFRRERDSRNYRYSIAIIYELRREKTCLRGF